MIDRFSMLALLAVLSLGLLGGFALGVIAGESGQGHRLKAACDVVPTDSHLRLVWQQRTDAGFDWDTDQHCAYYITDPSGAWVEVRVHR